MSVIIQMNRALLLRAHSLEALFEDLNRHQQAWDSIFRKDTDVVKASRIAELMAALATLHFQRGNYMQALFISAKSSEILIHMIDIIEERMPARRNSSTMTAADFPSPSGTFLAMDCSDVPDEREARILRERLAFKNNERVLEICLCGYRSDRLKFQPIIQHGCYALRRLMSWELDYQVT